MLPSLWDGCRRRWHDQDNLRQQHLVPTMKQRFFPPSCAPVMTLNRVTRQFRGLEHEVLLRMRRKIPGNVLGWEEAYWGLVLIADS